MKITWKSRVWIQFTQIEERIEFFQPLKVWSNLNIGVNHANFSKHRSESCTTFQNSVLVSPRVIERPQWCDRCCFLSWRNLENKATGDQNCFLGLEYIKNLKERTSTHQRHFVFYFVSPGIDPSSDIIGSLEQWVDCFVRQDFVCCRFHL